MKILFTGASSFTGYWFISELVQRGHEVTAVLRNAPEKYCGVRRERVDRLVRFCGNTFECSFGDDTFLERIGNEKGWDVLCHHAAEVTDYKSADFEVIRALANNTLRLRSVPREVRDEVRRHAKRRRAQGAPPGRRSARRPDSRPASLGCGAGQLEPPLPCLRFAPSRS